MNTIPASPPATAAGWRRALVIGAGFVVLYILLAWIARFYLVRPFAITPWNPAAGLALALLLVCGLRYWPALAVAAVCTALLLRGLPPPPYVQWLAPAVLVSGYVGMAALLRGPLRLHLGFDQPGELVKLAAVAAGGTLVMALAYVAIFRTSAMTDLDYRYIALRFWIGHLIGIVINTPLLLLLVRSPQRAAPTTGRAPGWESAAQAASVVFVLWLIFSLGRVDPYKLFYLLFLPVIWIAARHGITGAILGIAGVQLGLIVALVNADFQSVTAVTEFQFMMLALAIAGLVIGMTVTQNRNARTSLARSDARLRAVLATAPDGIVTIDRAGGILAANPAAAQIFGYGTTLPPGLAITRLLPAFESLTAGREAGTLDGVRADGARFPVEVAIGGSGEARGTLEFLALLRELARDLDAPRDVAHDRDAQFLRALAAAGEMAAALAHELHQPLTAIRSYARAADQQPDAPVARTLPARIEAEAARAARVVQRLRDFFRGGASTLETVAAGELVAAALAPLRETAAGRRVALETRIEAPAQTLLVDRVQVETVIHSLVHNACEALAGAADGRIEVAVSPQADGFVRFTVADNGPGIAPAIASRLFEPFATTKPAGTGMGLAMSRSMIEAHGGRIWCAPPAAGGTVIHFTLPSTGLNEAAE